MATTEQLIENASVKLGQLQMSELWLQIQLEAANNQAQALAERCLELETNIQAREQERLILLQKIHTLENPTPIVGKTRIRRQSK